jgi:hypothetical protein
VLAYLWKFLHLLFAFSFVGALTIAEWNGRAARSMTEWGRRAALWGVVRVTTQVLGIGALVLLGIFGNLLALSFGLPMGGLWMRVVNGVWLIGLLLYLLAAVPTANRLVTLCEAAARGGSGPAGEEPAGSPPAPHQAPGKNPEGDAYAATLGRWRMANVLLSIFFVLMLVLMVLRSLMQ